MDKGGGEFPGFTYNRLPMLHLGKKSLSMLIVLTALAAAILYVHFAQPRSIFTSFLQDVSNYCLLETFDSHAIDSLSITVKSIADTTDILDKLAELQPTSQRLIVGLSDEYSSDNFFYKLFHRSSPLPKYFSLRLEEKIIIKASQKSIHGFGGIDLRPSFLLSQKSLKALNAKLNAMRASMQLRVILTDDSGTRLGQVLIQPFVFMDWNERMEGHNTSIASLYSELKTEKALDPTIIRSFAINGVFSPRLDYFPEMKDSLASLRAYVAALEKANIMCFIKHFGYRKDYRSWRDAGSSGIRKDIHFGIMEESTPLETFLNQDMEMYRNMIDSLPGARSGIMVGHHFQICLDSTANASLSQPVAHFIHRGFSRRVLLISDSYDMKNAYEIYDLKNILKSSPLDLLLVSHVPALDWESLSGLCKGDLLPGKPFAGDTYHEILKKKLDLGLIKILQY